MGGDAQGGPGLFWWPLHSKPPQCLLLSQAEPREMPINSLRISGSHFSVTLLGCVSLSCSPSWACVSPVAPWKEPGRGAVPRCGSEWHGEQ